MSKKELQERISKAQKDRVATLNLTAKNIKDLPASIGQLTELKELYLDLNQLTTLPPEIGQLKNLMTLSVEENRLKNLPLEIGKLVNLTRLSLTDNQITSLPPEISKLTNLSELYLRNNKLGAVPLELTKLTNLLRLSLNGNQIETIPPEIGRLGNLISLSFADNQLTELPPEIGRLTNLAKFSLRKNKLINLPPEIGNLKNLSRLYLQDNCLTNLPSQMGKLKNLSMLFLQNNHLTMLPPDIRQFHIEKKLRLESEGNPFGEIVKLFEFPPEYYDAGLKVLLYFEKFVHYKYPNISVKTDTRNYPQVKMLIEAPGFTEKEKEEIENAFTDYMLIVKGDREPQDVIKDSSHLKELERKLESVGTELGVMEILKFINQERKDREEIKDELRKISHYLRPKGIRSDIFSKTRK